LSGKKASVTQHDARPQLIARRLIVRAKDVVFVKGVVDAHEGLASVCAERGGVLTLVAAEGCDRDLDELVNALAVELGGIVQPIAEVGDG
jgi:hypothetical protein